LQEEMKRVKLFFQTRADILMVHRNAVGNAVGMMAHAPDSVKAECLCGFASEQASQFSAMHSYCERLWRYVPAFVRLGQGEVVPAEAQVDDDNETDIVNT
jgi:hypothetical protein